MLGALDEADGWMAARVRGRMSAQDLTLIDHSTSTRWVPVELNERLNAAMLAEMGAEGYTEFYRAFARTVSSTPLFDVLAKGAIRLFLLSPQGILKTIPRAWSAAAKDVCEIAVEPRGPGHVTVRITQVAVPCRNESMVYSWKGSLLGALDLVQCEAEIDAEDAELLAGTVIYQVRW